MRDRLRGPLDGALHLLDRQVVDVDGRLVCKVDDVELTQQGGRLVITGLLSGPPALLGRVGGRLGRALERWWASLKPPDPHRSRPWRLDLDAVSHLDSAVHLNVARDGAMRRDRDRRRLGALTGMRVHGPEGERIGSVLDARFQPVDGALTLTSLVVGRGRPGGLLGYDRSEDQGPAVVRTVVRALHRHTVLVSIEDAAINWEVGAVSVTSGPRTHRVTPSPDDGPPRAPTERCTMTKELHVVDVETGEVVERVDVSLRGSAEVAKTREALEAKAEAGHEVREID